MRLIDADLLEPDADYDDGEYWAVSITQIQGAPTIEPERKKGRWLLFGDSYMEFCKCSNCGHSEDTKKNFCPECGADMRGGKDEWRNDFNT